MGARFALPLGSVAALEDPPHRLPLVVVHLVFFVTVIHSRDLLPPLPGLTPLIPQVLFQAVAGVSILVVSPSLASLLLSTPGLFLRRGVLRRRS